LRAGPRLAAYLLETERRRAREVTQLSPGAWQV
jgi:hypothetical protein